MAFSRPRFATSSSSSSSSLPMTIFNLFFRILQFVFGVAVIGLYAADLHAAHKAHKYTDSKWGYAVAVGTLGAVTALVYILPRLKSFYAFGWDIILFILWVVVFAIFGKMYIHEDPEGDKGVGRMKNAVWVDLINMLLWFMTSISGAVIFFFFRGGKSRFTGRATV